MRQKKLTPGVVFHVFPGIVHRVESISNLLMIESSTVELDDVYRLQDDTSRGHGKIESEHARI